MVAILTQIQAELPPELSGINERSFWIYLAWQGYLKEFEKMLIEKFETSAKAAAGYTDENRPENPLVTPLPIGDDVEFRIITTPTTKRPSYKTVNERFGSYLKFLLEQYRRGIPRKDVRTIDGQAYAAVDDLLIKIGSDLESALEGKEGIKQVLEPVRPVDLILQVPERAAVLLERDYSQLDEANARAYILASNFLNAGNERTKPFVKLLLEDSLALLGKRPEQPVALVYNFDGVNFVHYVEPRLQPKSKGVLDAFIKPAPERIARNSTIGDLVKLNMLKESGKAELLEQKGLIDQNFRQDYHPAIREGVVYARLEGIIARLETYRSRYVTPSIEQNIVMRPDSMRLAKTSTSVEVLMQH